MIPTSQPLVGHERWCPSGTLRVKPSEQFVCRWCCRGVFLLVPAPGAASSNSFDLISDVTSVRYPFQNQTATLSLRREDDELKEPTSFFCPRRTDISWDLCARQLIHDIYSAANRHDLDSHRRPIDVGPPVDVARRLELLVRLSYIDQCPGRFLFSIPRLDAFSKYPILYQTEFVIAVIPLIKLIIIPSFIFFVYVVDIEWMNDFIYLIIRLPLRRVFFNSFSGVEIQC